MRDTHESPQPLFGLIGFALITVFMLGVVYLTPTPMESAIEAEPQSIEAAVFLPQLKPSVFEPTVISHHIDAGGHAYRVNDTCSADQPGVIEAGIELATGDVAEGCFAYDDVE